LSSVRERRKGRSSVSDRQSTSVNRARRSAAVRGGRGGPGRAASERREGGGRQPAGAPRPGGSRMRTLRRRRCECQSGLAALWRAHDLSAPESE
jgi:hypothetical protein